MHSKVNLELVFDLRCSVVLSFCACKAVMSFAENCDLKSGKVNYVELLDTEWHESFSDQTPLSAGNHWQSLQKPLQIVVWVKITLTVPLKKLWSTALGQVMFRRWISIKAPPADQQIIIIMILWKMLLWFIEDPVDHERCLCVGGPPPVFFL